MNDEIADLSACYINCVSMATLSITKTHSSASLVHSIRVVCEHFEACPNKTFRQKPRLRSVLEITVGHWPFSDQFQDLVDQISHTFSMG